MASTKTIEIPTNKDDAIAFHRAELERLTGKMIDLRDREKFNEKQRRNAQRRRKRLAQLEKMFAKQQKAEADA